MMNPEIERVAALIRASFEPVAANLPESTIRDAAQMIVEDEARVRAYRKARATLGLNDTALAEAIELVNTFLNTDRSDAGLNTLFDELVADGATPDRAVDVLKALLVVARGPSN